MIWLSRIERSIFLFCARLSSNRKKPELNADGSYKYPMTDFGSQGFGVGGNAIVFCTIYGGIVFIIGTLSFLILAIIIQYLVGNDRYNAIIGVLVLLFSLLWFVISGIRFSFQLKYFQSLIEGEHDKKAEDTSHNRINS